MGYQPAIPQVYRGTVKMDYNASSVLITGASRGIGREIAIAFASLTDRPLILVARDREKLEETKSKCEEAGGVQAEVLICDLTDENQTGLITIPDHIPFPGILINNAGSFLLKTLSQTSYKELLDQIQTNFFAAVNTTTRFLEELKSLDRALIINICSAGSLEGLRESGAYAASKHALLGYSRSLRKELMDTNVGVTAINLGQTQSHSWTESSIDPTRLIDPRDVAHLIVALSRLSSRTLVEEIIMKPQHGRVPPM